VAEDTDIITHLLYQKVWKQWLVEEDANFCCIRKVEKHWLRDSNEELHKKVRTIGELKELKP